MSYIDSTPNELLGYLGYLPIYHPLGSSSGAQWQDADFNFSPKNLVLGGGGGEHPGLVLHKLESLVVCFLLESISDEEFEMIDPADREYLDGLYLESFNSLEFCAWSIEDFCNLDKMARSSSLQTVIEEGLSVEEWLKISIGEFIYFSLTELNPEHEKLSKIFSKFKINPSVFNVLCLPQGYPVA